MPAGYSGTPLPKKLGIKPGFRVGVVHPPEHLDTLLAELPEAARCLRLRAGAPRYEVVLLFALNQRTLERSWARAAEALDTDGGLWVGWPKKSSPLHTDLAEGFVRNLGLEAGLVDNKICAIDEDWSGLRFVYRVEDRPALREKRAAK